MKLAILWCGIVSASVAVAQTTVMIASSLSNGTVQAFSASGRVALQTVSVRLEVHPATRANRPGNLVVVYDPKGGYYFWNLYPANDPADTTNVMAPLEAGSYALYTSPSVLLAFVMSENLAVLERKQSAPNLDSALIASIEEIRIGLTRSGGYWFDRGYKQLVSMAEIGPVRDCDSERENSSYCPARAVKFVSIGRDGANWRLVINGKWNQEVILDSKLDFMSTSRVTPYLPMGLVSMCGGRRAGIAFNQWIPSCR